MRSAHLENSLKELSKAFRQQRELREESAILNASERFLEAIGGPEHIGLELAKNFQESHGRLRLDYHKIVLHLMEARDQANADTLDLSGVDEEDLKAYVTELAVRLISEDEQFRDAVVVEALRRQPALLDQLDQLVDVDS